MGGSFNEALTAAEDLWKQGDPDGAWLKLEELEPIDRVMPEVIDLRLHILTCLCKWDLGDDLASVLRFAVDEDDEEDDEYRNRYTITCAEYYHARARALCAEGDSAGARERAKLAGELWPPIRLEMLEDSALDEIWIVGKPPAGAIDCKCDPEQWPNGLGAVCDDYKPFSESDRDCRHCDHREECHEQG